MSRDHYGGGGDDDDDDKLISQYSLTKNELIEYKTAFSLFDKNNDGSIGKEELHTVMASLGEDPSPKELQDIMDSIGEDTITFSQFIKLMRNVPKGDKTHSKDELYLAAFKVFDQNHDGFISAEELISISRELGEKLEVEEIEEMIREADENGDGVVDFEEFKKMMGNLAL